MIDNREHRLVGLVPDNLLAFLALLGLLRALEVARPHWAPRVRWDAETAPTRPVLILASSNGSSSIAAAAAEGCDTLAPDYEFGGWKTPNGPQQQAREMLRQGVERGPDGRH